ncbi:MAG: spore cortex biosynthesis protein YabQ [Tepidanaerobacteraceae bacterium]|nr:spore cortex biosynthesis protein YabQ [Tepidanaerobacteraceae bacterium]
MDFYENSEQAVMLAAALAIGLFAGLVFDVYRRIRNLIVPGPVLTALGDLAFWGIMTVVTFLSLFRLTSGEVRGYIFFALGIGLLFYLSYISRYVLAVLIFFDILTRRNIKKFMRYLGRMKKLAVFTLPARIYEDARRVFFKIKHKK